MPDGLLPRMYQYSRAIYRSIKDLIDPYADPETRLQYRREVLAACEDTRRAARQGSALLLAARPGALPGHPPLLPDRLPGQGQLGDHAGDRRGRRLHRAPDRVGRVRRRGRPLPRHDPQGEAVPAHAAPRPRVLPLAPASRDHRASRPSHSRHERELHAGLQVRDRHADEPQRPGRSASARSRSAQASSLIRSPSSVPTASVFERLRMEKSG